MFSGIFFKNLSTPTHAGGVVYREVNGLKEYLLVSSKQFPFIWVLPKGHIEYSEKEEDAALREVLEESGIEALLLDKLGDAKRLKWSFKRWSFKKQVVAFYLMKFLSVHSINNEGRKLAWLTLGKAITRLWYSDQKAILRKLKT